MARLKEAAGPVSFDEAAAALVAAEGGDVTIDVYRKIPFIPSPATTEFTAQAVEVEVDTDTGQVKVRRVVTSHDVGTIINPASHQGQIAGGAVQGFGMAMMEEFVMAEGKPLALNLADYKIPTIMDIPVLETVLVSRDDGPGTLQQRGHRRISERAHGSGGRQRGKRRDRQACPQAAGQRRGRSRTAARQLNGAWQALGML